MKKLNPYHTIFELLRANSLHIGRGELISNESLRRLVIRPEYGIFRIPKKNGGTRLIHSPCIDLMRIQKALNHYLQNEYAKIRPECVHGFVSAKGKFSRNLGIYSNAFPHTGNLFVLNLDIHHFFPSIKARRIKAFLLDKLNLNDNVASIITQLCTYEGFLPSGAPTSPALSNFYCYEMDLDLMKFAESNKLIYTRYADDLTFSSQTKIESEYIDAIKSILHSYDFTINKRKFRIKGRQQRQMVTGLVVNDKVMVPREYRRKLRAIIHDIKKNGAERAARKHYNIKNESTQVDLSRFQQKINGQIGFVNGILNETRRIEKIN